MSKEFFHSPSGFENSIPGVGAFQPMRGETEIELNEDQLQPQSQDSINDPSLIVTSQEAPTLEVSPEEETASEDRIEPTTALPVKPQKSFWREVLETVILTILIFFLAESVIQPFRIQGSSMDPTFHTDQLLMVNKAAYFHFDINPWLRLIPGVKADGASTFWVFGGPQRGDVVVFEYPRDPSQDYIKRIIGLPGDKVEIKNGIVYINDIPLTEHYIKEAPFSPYGPVVVPQGSLFVMGDNRNGSSDSRAWGFLPLERVIGKAMLVYWPFGTGWGFVSTPTYN